MIIRNSIDINILASVTRAGIMEIHTLNESGEFVQLTDERVLYEELLTHLVNEIREKGYRVTDGSFDGEPLDNLFVEKADCSPVSPDHEFEDDCERI